MTTVCNECNRKDSCLEAAACLFPIDYNERPGIIFKPIQHATLPKNLPRFRILWIDGLPQFYPLKTVMQTIWFDGPDGLLGLKANGDLT